MLGRLTLLVLLLLAACGGDDSGPPPPPSDGGTSDGGTIPRDGGMPRRDSGPSGCPSGQHECGPECTPDMPDDPTNGCRLGCGDACPVPANAMATCASGDCDFECIPPAVRSGASCTCEATTCSDVGAECGMIDDGCGGTVPCGDCPSGSTCTDGRCGCAPDAAEVNDTRDTAFDLGIYDDSDATAMVYSAWSVSGAADEDWYEIQVVDGFDFGNPVLRVELSGIPLGSNYDLYVWFVCGGGSEAVTCSAGMPDASFGQGCASASSGVTSELVSLDIDCTGFGTDDSGTAWIRVAPTLTGASCAPYTVDVSID